MFNVDVLPFKKIKYSVSSRHVLCGVLMLAAAAGLAACGNKDKKAGQTLARVNGEEITILQLNDELRRAGVQAGQQEAASKQLLESMIDRQLILAEAMRNKIDRTPDVMQAIERAKAQIIAQAYLQSVMSKVAKPSKAEIDDYFQKHPEFFTKRKEFDLEQLVIANKNFSDELKLFIDSAKSLDEVAAWMDKHDVQYARGQTTRNTTDLPQQAVAKLLELPKGQLFIVGEGDNRVINIVTAIKDSPVTAKNAAPQIEQFLINKMSREAAEVEITHLRSLAKIEYPNASAPAAVQAPATAPDNKAAVVPEKPQPSKAGAGYIEKGLKGL
ncbi:MAG TPA: EpsD family peptidyl-prolyl cis-trans isomerase [Gallionella sp.]